MNDHVPKHGRADLLNRDRQGAEPAYMSSSSALARLDQDRKAAGLGNSSRRPCATRNELEVEPQVSTWCRDGTQSACATREREAVFRSLGGHGSAGPDGLLKRLTKALIERRSGSYAGRGRPIP